METTKPTQHETKRSAFQHHPKTDKDMAAEAKRDAFKKREKLPAYTLTQAECDRASMLRRHQIRWLNPSVPHTIGKPTISLFDLVSCLTGEGVVRFFLDQGDKQFGFMEVVQANVLSFMPTKADLFFHIMDSAGVYAQNDVLMLDSHVQPPPQPGDVLLFVVGEGAAGAKAIKWCYKKHVDAIRFTILMNPWYRLMQTSQSRHGGKGEIELWRGQYVDYLPIRFQKYKHSRNSFDIGLVTQDNVTYRRWFEKCNGLVEMDGNGSIESLKPDGEWRHISDPRGQAE